MIKAWEIYAMLEKTLTGFLNNIWLRKPILALFNWGSLLRLFWAKCIWRIVVTGWFLKSNIMTPGRKQYNKVVEEMHLLHKLFSSKTMTRGKSAWHWAKRKWHILNKGFTQLTRQRGGVNVRFYKEWKTNKKACVLR